MFSSISSFLWFFIPMLTAIVFGIAYEETLIRIEHAIVKTIHEVLAEKRYQKAIRVAYKGYQSDRKAKDIRF